MTVPLPAPTPGPSSKGPSSKGPGRAATGRSGLGRARDDLVGALRLWRLGVMLGWLDIKLRYRGSALGPFWLTITSALMVASMGVLYSRLFHQDLRTYLPFLSLSMTLWQTGISALVQESCTCFIDAEGMIRSAKLPLLLQAVRMIVRISIVFAHNIVVPFAVFVIYGVAPGFVALLSIPSLLLWAADGVACCMLFGALCARFRDTPQIVAAVMQVVFYVTPVIWMPQQLNGKARMLLLNPFYALLEIVRAPLLGHMPPASVWAMAIGPSVLLCGLAVRAFARVRSRVVFWV